MTVLMCMLPRVEERCNANIGSVVMRDGICLLQGGLCCRVDVGLRWVFKEEGGEVGDEMKSLDSSC